MTVISFFGKTKGKTIDRVLGKMTAGVAIVFCLLVIVMFVAQDQDLIGDVAGAGTDTTDAITDTDTTADGTDTSADTADESTEDTGADAENAAE